jgi:hypothetical protein
MCSKSPISCLKTCTIQRQLSKVSVWNIMSMLLPCDTMSMRNLLSVISTFSNGEAQVLVRARSTTLAWMIECPHCYTCTLIWKRWSHISCKSLFYPFISLPKEPYLITYLSYSKFDEENWTYSHQPTSKQLDTMRQHGRQGRPNFVDWFREHVNSLYSLLSCHLAFYAR